jgi:hypothetical protein
MVLDSAYALRSERISLELLAAVLSSRAVELWLRETGIPLRGGYVRMKTRYLESLPIPAPCTATTTAETLAAELSTRNGVSAQELAELDDLVRVAYGVPLELWHAAD